MTFDGSVLWMSGDDDPGTTITPMFYRIDVSTGALIDTVAPPAQIFFPGGLAYTGSYIAVLDGLDIHYLDNTGSYVTSSPAPAGLWTDGLAFDGTSLWGTDGFDTVMEFDNGGSILSSFVMTGTFPANGLAAEGAGLWVAGSFSSSVIKKVDATGNLLDSVDVGIEFPSFRDLAFDGTYLWVVDDYDDTLYKLRVR